MIDGYWLVRVDRVTGDASTELIGNADEAWQRSLDEADPRTYTTVVGRQKGVS